jgi:pimeloyl-ACP methyl ester carboxylesterase
MTVKTITLENEVILEYVEQGNSTGLPVILLHGFTDSWRSFESVLPYLPSHLHVYAITQRGHGNSSKPATGYNPRDFADDVAAFMRAVKLKSAVVVGHSMGSTIAQCFAVNYPELTEGIVLVASFADFEQPHIVEFRDFLQQLSDPIDSIFIAEFQAGTIQKPISDHQLKTFIGESMKVPARVWKDVSAQWVHGNFAEALKNYDKSALIIWGDKDAYCFYRDQKVLMESLRHSTLITFEGIGHAVHWEEPERFALHLTKFVSMND